MGQNSAKELIDALIKAYFKERKVEKILECVSDDVEWVGKEQNDCAYGKAELRTILDKSVALYPNSFDVDIQILREKKLSEDIVDFTIIGTQYSSKNILSYESRSTIVCKNTESGWLVVSIHISSPNLEKELEEQRKKEQLILASMPGGVAIYRFKKNHTFEAEYVSKGFAILSGYDSVEEFQPLLNANPFFDVLEEDHEAMMNNVLDSIKNNRTFLSMFYHLRRKDGNVIFVRIEANRIDQDLREDELAVFYAVHTPVSDNSQRIINEQKFFDDLINSVPSGIGIYEIKDNIISLTFMNNAFYSMLGSTRESRLKFVGDNTLNASHPDDKKIIINAVQELKDGKDITSFEFRVKSNSGEWFWVHFIATVIERQDHYLKIYCSISDYNAVIEARNEATNSYHTMETALNVAKILVWHYDLKTKCMTDSGTFGEFYHAPKRIENVPKAIVDMNFIDKDSVPAFYKMYDDMANEVIATCEVECMRPDGASKIWYKLSYIPVFDKNNKLSDYIGIAVDVSDEKLAEQRYKNENSLRKDLIKDCIFYCYYNLTTKKIEEDYCGNSEFKEYFENITKKGTCNWQITYQNEDATQQFFDIFSIDNLLKAWKKGQTTVEFSSYTVHVNNRSYVLETKASLIKHPITGDIMALYYTKDITEKSLNDIIEQRLLENHYDGISVINCLTNSVLILADAYTVEGLYIKQKMSYREACELFANQFSTVNDKQHVLEMMDLSKVVSAIEKDGSYSFVSKNIEDSKKQNIVYRSSYYFLDSSHDYLLFVMEDVTAAVLEEQKKQDILQNALQAAEQASRAKTEFLSRMSHEIRTPMNAILGISSVAIDDVNDPKQALEDLSKINLSARYLLSLINDILDMSRIESGRVVMNHETIIFDEFINGINNIIYPQCSEKGIDYDAIVSGFVDTAYIGDIVKLQQILINILGNSVKFTPAGGKVTLKIEQVMQQRDFATLRFTITDTGIGISDKFLPHLFNPFEQEITGNTTTYGGTGLGLAISKSMVELMDGNIAVNSVKGVGTEFVVEVKLGLSDKAIQNAELKQHLQIPTLNILVVDDDIVVCKNMQSTLKRMQMISEFATSGYQAINMVKERFESNKNFDLILLDWKMPGMDGIETAKEIRKVVGPDVTIIIMTAYDWTQIEKIARSAGVNMFMQKPLFQSTLTSAFQKIYCPADLSSQNNVIEYDLTGTHILLAEDHPLNVEVATRLLEKKGAKVTVAPNGLEAIECFSSNEPNYFDAILMDIRMPVMDGLTAAKNIRQLKKEGSSTVPIIAMSANAFEDDVKRSLECGMNAHLAKPIDSKLMYATLYKFIRENK